jgi:hypothetical protein
MKRTLTTLSAILVITTASVVSANAQVSVNVNIGAQPMWAPVGYASAEYYYLPDIECYYNVPRRQFVYLSGPNWVFSYNLPSRCRGYDLYSGYKVVCAGPRPYTNFYHDREAYARYRGWRGHQQVWRDYRGPRGGGYVVDRYPGPGRGYGHDRGGYDDDHGHGRGHGRGHDRW